VIIPYLLNFAMVVALFADQPTKQEILAKPLAPGAELVWADSLRSLIMIEADLYLDLEFDIDPERIARLKKLQKPVVVNSVIHTISQINAPFLRINAWPGMLQRETLEIALPSNRNDIEVGQLFGQLGWPITVVPDLPGMVTPRILAMMINEAWHTFAEGVSSREEIDTAMKLGTNYPYGPFEWCARIGEQRVVELLKELHRTDAGYTIAPPLLNATT